MIELIPAIMPASLIDLKQKLELVAGHVPRVQLDIMDGKFVKARSWPYAGDMASFKKILKEEDGLPLWDSVDFEIDLMIEKPEAVISDWITAGASRFVIHIESTKAIAEIVTQFNEWFSYNDDGTTPEGEKRTREIELGLALNIDTPTDMILPHLEDVDFIQFMGIAEIGYQGETFDERVLDKIRDFHNAHPEIIISVDGGVDADTAPLLIEAGAHRLISGSAVFEGDMIAENIKHLKQSFAHL